MCVFVCVCVMRAVLFCAREYFLCERCWSVHSKELSVRSTAGSFTKKKELGSYQTGIPDLV